MSKNKQDKVYMNINVTFYTIVSLCSNSFQKLLCMTSLAPSSILSHRLDWRWNSALLMESSLKDDSDLWLKIKLSSKATPAYIHNMFIFSTEFKKFVLTL